MVKKRELSPKPMFDETLLIEAFNAHNISPKHAQRLWRYFVQQGAESVSQVPELPKAAIKLLEAEFTPMTSRVVSLTDNADGSTTKLLVELQDGQRIESVIMRYGDVALASFPEEERERLKTEDGSLKFRSNKRATLCVSSQVGCAMGCTFCATGTMGLLSNLSAGEILEQLIHANKVERIRNVVFMGMGEPLDNYSAVLTAIKGMVDTARFGLSPARISLSTVGVVPRLLALARDMPDVGLALSLHAPTQELRTQIVPTAKGWHIDRIMEATDAFIAQQNARIKSHNRRRHVLIEYVLIAGVNDSHEVAHQLGALLRGRDVLLNVIPYNPTSVPHDYKPPSAEATRSFVEIVRKQYDVHTLLRQELGQDISSACGQLVIDSISGGRKNAPAASGSGSCATGSKIADLEDLAGPGSAGGSASGVRSRTAKKTAGGASAKSVAAAAASFHDPRGMDVDYDSSVRPPNVVAGEMQQHAPSVLIMYSIASLAILFSVRILVKMFWA